MSGYDGYDPGDRSSEETADFLGEWMNSSEKKKSGSGSLDDTGLRRAGISARRSTSSQDVGSGGRSAGSSSSYSANSRIRTDDASYSRAKSGAGTEKGLSSAKSRGSARRSTAGENYDSGSERTIRYQSTSGTSAARSRFASSAAAGQSTKGAGSTSGQSTKGAGSSAGSSRSERSGSEVRSRGTAAGRTASRSRSASSQGRSGGGTSSPGRGSGNILPWILAAIAVVAVIIMLILIAANALSKAAEASHEESIAESLAEESMAEESIEAEKAAEQAEEEIFARAELLAMQYDYDSAIELLGSADEIEDEERAIELIEEYERIKGTLVEQEILSITHIFFHILSVDPENSFDSSRWGTQAEGYNSLMTTVDEFREMMQQMYDRGYVLVSIRDLAHEETQEDGSVKMVRGSIMLPEGKQAFVMSEDDVCYYEYMEGAGFSDLMVVGEDGRPQNHYVDRDGNEYYGAYDLPTILDEFIDEHPDFSYHGHKACLVFTGYNGVLGYRTDESYDPDSEYYDPSLEQGHDVAAEREEAVKVLRALHEDGYDLGSHSWGHRDLGEIEMARFTKDCDRWERNVASLIREATGEQPDIIIYPKGADVGDWHPYTSDNERFNYLYDLGFRYFCNVDNNQYWVQLGDKYLRQGRRALDGYNLWLDVSGQYSRLTDIFSDTDAIFDYEHRPTPVPAY